MTIPSRTEFLSVVREVTRRFGELSGFDRGQAEQLALAVDEAATNVIEHAYAGSGEGAIEVRYDDAGEDLRIEIVDEGKGVDPRDVPTVDLRRYASERRTGGLGMHLMGQIMDAVSFARTGRRNVCRLVKRKPAGAVP
jgi:anti-sigma regulatory factor (Ser/Thr protein kinase)